MIIWSRLGILVPVLAFAACFGMQLIVDGRYGDGYYSAHDWTVGLALVAGGAVYSLIGFMVKPSIADRPPGTKEDDPQARCRSPHTFFFIPMHRAGIAVAGIGVYFLLKEAVW